MKYRLFSKTTLLACLLCLATLLPSAAHAADTDGDGIDDSIDNCPTIKNPDQKNWDGDVWDINNPDTGGDLCDEDDDNDGHKDTADLFPHNAAEWADNDKDGIGDTADPDDDNDGVFDAVPDNCPLIANPNQLNTDANSPNGDSDGDACDSDEDGDDYLHLGIKDAFPLDNTEWSDRDGDGTGDNADLDNNNNGINDDIDDDDDSDGILDVDDKCPWTNSLDQTNTDGDIWDGINLNKGGDVCDTDDDNDGHLDINNAFPLDADAFPLDASEWQDSDGDGVGDNGDKFPDDATEWANNDAPVNGIGGDTVGDNRDPDDDNDRIPDRIEIALGLNRFNAADALLNPDGDANPLVPYNAYTNLDEYLAGTDRNNAADTPATRKPRQYKMVTNLGTAGDSLGSAVAILGGTTVVGAPNGYMIRADKTIATVIGGAYTFTSIDSGSSWQQNAKIIPTSSAHTRLGKAVALANSGSDLLLSADGTNNAGVVFIYTFSGGEWNPTQILTAADSGTSSNNNQGFGNSIVVSGNTALISAPGTNTSGNFAGAAYIYVRNNDTNLWEYKATLKGGDTTTQNFFGSSIALENGRAVIGASGVSNKGANSGKVYVFEDNGASWSQTNFQGSDTDAGHYFGSSVALSGDTLVVGASGVSGSGANAGAAYVFKLGSNWTEQAKLTAPASDAAAQLFFGFNALMIDNKTVMIGTPYANSRGKSSTGGIYIYRLVGGNWTFNGKLQSHDRQSGDYYGYRLAYGLINTTPTLIVGAPGVDDNGDGAGAAYSVNLIGIDTDDDGDKIADAFDNCLGLSNNGQEDLDGDDKGDVCDDNIDGDGALNGADAFPLDGNETLDTDGDGMGDNIDPDADDDGIPDRIEEATKLYDANNNLLGALNWLVDTDAAEDLDGDGYSNLAEYLAGTDMTDAASNPGKLTAIFQKLITKDGTLNDRFGGSVAIAGDYAIIGAVNGKSNGSSGAAYIFEKDGAGNWSQKEIPNLVASDATNLAKFGSSVAIFGNIAVVGAPGASPSGHINAGAVYLFRRDVVIDPDGKTKIVWLQTDILTATEPGINHYFGSSVAINSTTRVVVGAPGAHKNSRIANTGAVYVFEFDGSNWQQRKLTAFDSKGNDGFGSSVAVAGDLVMAGSPLADSVDYATGAVYLFRPDGSGGWSEKRKLVASNGLNGDQFGSSIAFSALTQTVAAKLTYFGTLAVGAPGRDDSGASSGAAYAFSYRSTTGYNDDSAWTQETSLFKARDGARSDSLGASVALTFSVDGDGKRSATVVTGAKLRDSKNIDSGAVYLFTQSAGNGWVQQTPLAASDSKSYDYFGSSVAIDSNRRLLIGANGNDDNDIEAGAAFIVDYSETDSDADGIYNTFDNCVDIANPDQLNTDQNFSNGDSFGDACDDNDDGDVDKITGLPVNDVDDAFPLDPNEQYDTDGDGIGNNADEDDDNDGIPDDVEIANGMNPLLASDAEEDMDGDGLSNLKEYQLNPNPTNKNISNPDSDGDGYSDGIEDYYGTSPNDAASTPATIIALTPLKPVIKPIASPLPLTVRSFDTEPFKDAGPSNPDIRASDYLTESEWEINSFITFADNGRILRRNLRGVTSAAEEEKVRKLTIADAILLPGGHYWVRTRHRDNTHWSEWSEPVEISVSTEGSNDSNQNGVDDRYDAGRGFDANGDGAIDPASAEPNIVSLRNTGDSSIIGVQLSGTATFGQLSAIAYSTLPTSLTANGKMPYGLFNFRIEGLVASDASPAQVTVSFYLPTVPPAGAKWYKYNPSTNTLADMTTQVEILDKKVSLTLLDGSEDDADGVVNGVVVDPSGLYITLTDEEKLSGYKAGALSPLLLLGLLLCWPLRRLGRKQAV